MHKVQNSQTKHSHSSSIRHPWLLLPRQVVAKIPLCTVIKSRPFLHVSLSRRAVKWLDNKVWCSCYAKCITGFFKGEMGFRTHLLCKFIHCVFRNYFQLNWRVKQLHCRNFTTLIYVSFVVFGYNSYYVLKDFIIETQVVLFLFFLFFKLKKNPHNYVHATSRSKIKY